MEAPRVIVEDGDADILKILEPLTCCICLQIATAPVRPRHCGCNVDDCGLVLCVTCGRDWMRADRRASSSCPRCRRPIAEIPSTPHPVLTALTRDLRVRCEGCDRIDVAGRMHRFCPRRTVATLRVGHSVDRHSDHGILLCNTAGICGLGRCQWLRIMTAQLRHDPDAEVVAYFRECLPYQWGDVFRNADATSLAPVLPVLIEFATSECSVARWSQMAQMFDAVPSVGDAAWRFVAGRLDRGDDNPILDVGLRSADLTRILRDRVTDWVTAVLTAAAPPPDHALREAVRFLRAGHVPSELQWNASAVVGSPSRWSAELAHWIGRESGHDRWRSLHDEIVRRWPRRIDDVGDMSEAEMYVTVRRYAAADDREVDAAVARCWSIDGLAGLRPLSARRLLCFLWEFLSADRRARVARDDLHRLASQGYPLWPSMACSIASIEEDKALPPIVGDRRGSDPPWVSVGDAVIRTLNVATTAETAYVLLDGRYWDPGSNDTRATVETVRTRMVRAAIDARSTEDPVRRLLEQCLDVRVPTDLTVNKRPHRANDGRFQSTPVLGSSRRLRSSRVRIITT